MSKILEETYKKHSGHIHQLHPQTPKEQQYLEEEEEEDWLVEVKCNYQVTKERVIQILVYMS